MIKEFSARVEQLTGLDVALGGEPWHVLFYDLGGHYAPHNDYLKLPEAPAWYQNPWTATLIQIRYCWNRKQSWRLSFYCVLNWLQIRMEKIWLNQFRDPNYPFKQPTPMRNRIGTFIAYLSMPRFGGGTVFPLLNVTITPKAGDALFWFDSQTDGGMDTQTLHGGCPVVMGTKAIATMWIREFAQELRAVCPSKQPCYDLSSFREGPLKHTRK